MSVIARWRSHPAATTVPGTAVDVAAPAVAETGAPLVYVGLVTRAIAFGVDAGIINVVAIATVALVGLALSVLSVPSELHKILVAIGGVVYVLWAVGYFVTFWATTAGQTPGSRILHIRVRPVEGGRLKPRRALVRFVGLTLAAIPLLAGFAMILVDNRRRGLQDVLARTVVVEAPDDREPPPGRGRQVRRGG